MHSDRPALTRLRAAAVLPLYPALLACAFVLSEESRTGVAFGAVIRSQLLAVVLVIALTLVLRPLLRTDFKSGIAASAGLLLLRSGDLPHLLVAAVLALLVACALGLVAWRLRASSRGLNAGLNVVAVMLVIVTGAPIVAASAAGADTGARGGTPVAAAPDIYVILLDGYPRSDELERNLGVSDEPFLDALESRGFAVSPGAEANYMYTAPSLVAFFGLGRDQEILATSDRTPFTIGQLINESPGLDLLRTAGYRIEATVTRWEAESLRSADRFCDRGVLNEFELQLLRSSLAGRVLDAAWPGWRADRDRSVIDAELSCATELGADDAHPVFSWIHVGAPHLPVVFDADGGSAGTDVYLEPLEVTEDRRANVFAAYEEQLKYLHERTLAAVDDIIGRSASDPIVIVMSDHGSWLRIGGHYDASSDFRERFGNLFAARLPSREQLFPDDVTLSQVLPILANAYLGSDIDVPPRRFHFSWPDASLDAIEIPDPFVQFGTP